MINNITMEYYMYENELINTFDKYFTFPQKELIKKAKLAAKIASVSLYLVGGPVRDLFLNRISNDLDLLIEGEIGRFIIEFNKVLNLKPVQKSQFETYKYNVNNNEIDIALARTEIYPYPASLPQIKPSTINKDLYRRDFTINAIAYRIHPNPNILVDPLNGKIDIENKVLRIIHGNSFNDDPTRIFRAIRYSSRLQFAIDESTISYINQYRTNIRNLSGHRILNELHKFLLEPNIKESLSFLVEFNILEFIDNNIPNNDILIDNIDKLDEFNNYNIDNRIYLMSCLTFNMNEKQLYGLIERFVLSKKISLILKESIDLKRKISYLIRLKKPSTITNIFDKYNKDSLIITSILAKHSEFKKIVDTYIYTWSQISPKIKGNEISKLIKIKNEDLPMLIKKIRNARLNGVLNSKIQEEEYLKKISKQIN
jgi:tRNA nucleotidyltransferase/poly(A) polymerase